MQRSVVHINITYHVQQLMVDGQPGPPGHDVTASAEGGTRNRGGIAPTLHQRITASLATERIITDAFVIYINVQVN